jgi:hypothetical protein
MELTHPLTKAVERRHGARANWEARVPVRQTSEGKLVWEGRVEVFRLLGHAKANLCYAWSERVEGTNRKRFFSVLHAWPVQSALDAVKASLLADAR